jgi:ketoreductase
VVNAGAAMSAPLVRTSDEDWQRMLDLNLTAPFRCLRRALPAMTAAGRGRVVVVASIAGKAGSPRIAAYTASKHGVLGLVRAAAAEVAKTGVTVNAVCPGYVETPMAQRVRAGYAEAWATSEDDVLDRFNAKIPLGRYSTPEEVAGLVTYLVSPVADAVTAQAINVCGGLGNY